jgi:hypothetical protein
LIWVHSSSMRRNALRKQIRHIPMLVAGSPKPLNRPPDKVTSCLPLQLLGIRQPLQARPPAHPSLGVATPPLHLPNRLHLVPLLMRRRLLHSEGERLDRRQGRTHSDPPRHLGRLPLVNPASASLLHRPLLHHLPNLHQHLLNHNLPRLLLNRNLPRHLVRFHSQRHLS